jgi:Flp pilus assembly pilin Flp
MRGALRNLVKDRKGAAAAEMALVAPLLIILMFGAFELGNYFLAEHKVVKSVRDGARFASRQPFSLYPGCTPSSGLVTDTRNVTRTGRLSGGTGKLPYWTDPATITVTAACPDPTGAAYQGIYRDVAGGPPVVTVEATVPYTPLFASMGLGRVTLNLRARSQAAVMGI